MVNLTWRKISKYKSSHEREDKNTFFQKTKKDSSMSDKDSYKKQHQNQHKRENSFDL